MRAIILIAVLSIVLVSTAALADVPGLINYQGTLTDGYGTALDTTVAMTFSIYSDSTGGTQVWTETQSAVGVNNGVFNVLLGRVNAILDTVFNDPSRWIGVQVGGDPELQPRQRMAAVGYAFRAEEADTADYARSAQAIADGDWTLTGDHLYSAVPGSVGIGTTTPAAKLDVQGTINVGRDSSGYDVNFYGGRGLVGGARFHWDESKMALRAGWDSDGTHWAPDSIGYYSLATGRDTKAREFYSTAMGGHTIASGYYSTAMGRGTMASGSKSIAMGENTIASGDWSTATGYETIASADWTTAMGFRTIASGLVSTSIGSFTIASGNFSIAIGRYLKAGPADYTMVLGRGTSSGDTLANNIENSLMVGFNTATPTLFVGGADHRVGIGTDSPEEKLDVAGTARLTGFKMPTGASIGHVLTSDSTGVGSWQAALDGDWAVMGSDMHSAISGNVGIGTTTPVAKLDVAGTAQMTGFKMLIGASVGHVLTSDSTGVGSWQAVLDGDWTVMDSVMHSAVSGNVGIGTSSPRSKLDVRGTLNVGKYNPDMGYDVTFYGSTGGRLFWDEDKGALRTGLDYDGTHWAPDSVGYSSLATGYNTKAIGHNSIAMGAYTTARGVASTAMGVGTIASGDYSTAMGGYTTASGDYSTTIGRYVTADTTDAIVLGKGINSYYPLINNIPNSLMVGFDTTATLFVGGADDRVGIGTSSPRSKLDVRGTLNVGKYNPDMGYDVTFYGSTGGRLFWDEDKGALRTGLDYDGTHWAPDSVGYSSLATGYNTKAIGHNSIAMGAYTTARGVASTAMGVGTIASGDYSTAMGGYTTASGDYSTTIGRYVTADTTDAIVLGKGINSYYPLINNIPNSLMVGFDTTATLFVGGADDRVGIGTTNPTRKLWINGDAGGTSDWYNDSDERLKKNIKPIENPLDKVNRLKGVTFEWRDTENHFQGQQMGMIAQQVKEVVPEVVQKKGEYYSMATASLVPLLIEAMKELRAENGELRKEIEAIKAEFR